MTDFKKNAMTPLDILDIARQSLITMLFLAAPLLLTSLAIGLVISFVQALTQIQEITLTFVPKILGVLTVLLLSLPLMGKILENFSHELFQRIGQ